MRVLIVVVLVVLVAVGAVFAWNSQRAAREAQRQHTLYVMVPQGIFLSFNQILERFQQINPKVKITYTLDTPEAMAQMVEENPRKPDIFISPGGHELEVLREKGFIDPATEVAFGSYELALLVPADNPGKIKTLQDLMNPEVKVIAISKPDLNAACYAGRMSLQNLGLWSRIEPKLKVTKCCATSFNEIIEGRAEANIQFLGCPMDEKAQMTDSDKAAIACLFPRDTYYTPRNAAGILKTSKERAAAEEFLKFLTSPPAIELMLKYKLRNDRKLPATSGPWGPAQEANPKAKR